MRTLKAVLSGLLVTSVLIFAGGWASRISLGAAVGGEYSSPTVPAALLALVYTGAAVIAGAYVATKINHSGDTITGFAIAQMFFGLGLIREFWLSGANWYTLVALLLIIPCALLGHGLALGSRQTHIPRAA